MFSASSPPSGNNTSLLPRVVGAIVVLALGVGLISLRLPPWAEKMATDWGPAFVILASLAAGFVRYVPPDSVGKFIAAQQQQAVALSHISVSLAEKEGKLEAKLDQVLSGQQEVLLNLKVSTERLRRIEEQRHEQQSA